MADIRTQVERRFGIPINPYDQELTPEQEAQVLAEAERRRQGGGSYVPPNRRAAGPTGGGGEGVTPSFGTDVRNRTGVPVAIEPVAPEAPLDPRIAREAGERFGSRSPAMYPDPRVPPPDRPQRAGPRSIDNPPEPEAQPGAIDPRPNPWLQRPGGATFGGYKTIPQSAGNEVPAPNPLPPGWEPRQPRPVPGGPRSPARPGAPSYATPNRGPDLEGQPQIDPATGMPMEARGPEPEPQPQVDRVTPEGNGKATSAGGKPPAGGGPGGGGGRPAGPRKALSDQSRTERYDQNLDRDDPGNIGIVDDQGKRNLRYPANDLQPALKSAVSWWDRTFHQGTKDQHTQRGYDAMVKQNIGSPDPPTVEAVFKVVDPKGELPPNRRLELAVKATHDWYNAHGQPEKGAKAAAELLQFGAKMSKTHGVQAAQALKSGNVDEAVKQIQAGYGWLSDGHHVERRGNVLDVVDQNGNVTEAIPLDPKYINGFAGMMANGELAHQVYRARAGGGQQPQQAQPQQAQAITPNVPSAPAAPPGGSPTQTTTPRAAQPPAAAAGPATPTPAATPAPVTPAVTPVGKPATPAPAPAPAPAAPTQAIDTSASAGFPTGGVGMAKPGDTAPGPGPSQSGVPMVRDPTQPPPSGGPKDIHRYLPATANNAVTVTLGDQSVQLDMRNAEQQISRYFDTKRQEIIDSKPDAKVLNQLMTKISKQQGDARKQIHERHAEFNKERDKADADEKAHLKPHQVTRSETRDWESTWKLQEDAYRKDAEADPKGTAADVVNNGPLRFLTKEGQTKRLWDIARDIKVHNNTRINERQAHDIALDITRFVPDEHVGDDGKKIKVTNSKGNGRVGEDGAYFTRLKNDIHGNVVLRTTGGHTFSVPQATFNAVVDIRKEAYRKAKEEEDREAAKSENQRKFVDPVLKAGAPLYGAQ